MNKKVRAAQRYCELAVEQLSGNEYLPAYLLGLADAWRLMGDIDRKTFEDIRSMAKAIEYGRKEAQSA